MFGLFKARMAGFPNANKDVFLRAWWLAHKISRVVTSQVFPDQRRYWQHDEVFSEIDQELLRETLAFTMGHILQRLRDDIEKNHGWTNKSWEKNIGYQVLICKAFDETLKLEPRTEEYFRKLFESYYNPNYEVEYDEYWSVEDQVPELEGKTPEEVYELFNSLPSNEDYYNIDKLYVYRLSKIVKVVDREKVLDDARRLYQESCIPLYNLAFFDMPLDKIKAELKTLANS